MTYSQNTPLAIRDRANPKLKGKGKGQKNPNKKGKGKSTASGSGTQRGFKTFSQIRRHGTDLLHRTKKVQESVTGSRATSHVS